MAGILLNRSRQAPAEETPAFGGIAERFRRAGDLDRAIALCRDGLKRFPDQLSARVTLGWALLDQGKYDDARAELERVLRKAPDNLAAIRGLAELHDRSEGAMPAMEEVTVDEGTVDVQAIGEDIAEEADDAEPVAKVPTKAAKVAKAAKAAKPTKSKSKKSSKVEDDPFAPISVSLGSESTSAPPELLRTAEHANLAAEEAASADLAGAAIETAAPVELEDPAAASMAAAAAASDDPAPFAVTASTSDTTADLLIGTSSVQAFSVDAEELSHEVKPVRVETAADAFGLSESEEEAEAPSDGVSLSLDWAAPVAPPEPEPADVAPAMAFEVAADIDPADEAALADALKALQADDPSEPAGEVVAFEVTADAPASDLQLAEFQGSDDADEITATVAAIEASLQIEEQAATPELTAAEPVIAAHVEPEPVAEIEPAAALDAELDMPAMLEFPDRASNVDFLHLASTKVEVEPEPEPEPEPAAVLEATSLVEAEPQAAAAEAEAAAAAEAEPEAAEEAAEAESEPEVSGPKFELVPCVPRVSSDEADELDEAVEVAESIPAGPMVDLFAIEPEEPAAEAAEALVAPDQLVEVEAPAPAAMSAAAEESSFRTPALESIAEAQVEAVVMPAIEAAIAPMIESAMADAMASVAEPVTEMPAVESLGVGKLSVVAGTGKARGKTSKKKLPPAALPALESLLRRVEARRLQLRSETVA